MKAVRTESQSSELKAEITVLLPIYNDFSFLPQALDSCRAQRAVSIKILVLDNASTDGSTQYAESVATEDARVELVRRERNLGMIANFNDGLRRVDTPYFMLLCSDDLLLDPLALCKAVSLLRADAEAVSVYCDLQYVDRERRGLFQRRFRRGGTFEAHSALRKSIRTNRNQFGIPLLHRSSACKGLRYAVDLPYTTDVHLSAQIGERGRLHHIPETLIGNRYTGGNASRLLHTGVRAEFQRIVALHGLRLTPAERLTSFASQFPIALSKSLFLRLVSLSERRPD